MTSAGGGGVSNVTVDVFDPQGNLDASATTNAGGAYVLSGLDPSANPYTVCFDASNAVGGSSAYGYSSQCYRGVPWGASRFPAGGAKAVTLRRGELTKANAALRANGGISGTVIAAGGSTPLAGVTVDVLVPGDFVQATATTDSSGRYDIRNLPPNPSGYTVCFVGTAATGGAAGGGYADLCNRNVPWGPGWNPSSGTIAVPVAAMHSTTLDIGLPLLGSLSGRVTAAAGHGPLSNVTVDVFGPFGITSSTTTAADGSYAISGLQPDSYGYQVCFDATNAAGGATGGYASQCYDNVAWSPYPYLAPAGGSTALSIHAGATTRVDGSLQSRGAIAGTVVSAGGGAGLAGVFSESSYAGP